MTRLVALMALTIAALAGPLAAAAPPLRVIAPPQYRHLTLPEGPLWFLGATTRVAIDVAPDETRSQANGTLVRLYMVWQPKLISGSQSASQSVFGGLFSCATRSFRSDGGLHYDELGRLRMWEAGRQVPAGNGVFDNFLFDRFCKMAPQSEALIMSDRKEAAMFGKAAIEAMAAGRYAELLTDRVLDRTEPFATMKTFYPERFSALRTKLSTQPGLAASPSGVVQAMGEATLEVTNDLYSRADGDTVVAMAKLQMEALTRMAALSGSACDAIASGRPLDTAGVDSLSVGFHQIDRVQSAQIAQLIKTAKFDAWGVTPPDATPEMMQGVMRRAMESLPADVREKLMRALRDQALASAPPGSVCHYSANVLNEAIKLPQGDAVAVLRKLHAPKSAS